MRPGDRRAARGTAHEVQVTARDFAQTLGLLRALRDRPHGDRPPPRRRRSPPRASGLASRSGALVRWARGRGRSTSRSATAPTTSPSPPRCCGSRAATTFDYEWATRPAHDQLPPRPGGRRARRDPARAARAATARRRQAPPLRRAQGGVLPRRLRARPGGAGRARRSTRREPIAVVRTPPAVSLYHRFEHDAVRRRCSSALRGRAGGRAAAHARAARRADAAGGFIVPERAIDAQSLIAYADLVISAGGTMNREAVALGTPVCTTFEGRLGAVDERLIAEGRLRQLCARRGRRAAKRPRRRGRQPRIRRDPRELHRAAREGRVTAADLAAEQPRANRLLARCAAGFAPRPSRSTATPCLQVALDAGLVALAYYLAYRLRFDGGIPRRYHDLLQRTRSCSSCSAARRLRGCRALPAVDALLVASAST